MSKRLFLSLFLCAVVAIPSFGQTWSAPQQAALKVVNDSWVEIAARNVNWTDNMVHPNAAVWSDQEPMPLTRASVKKWDRFEFPNATMPTYEISPTAIVVEGGTAVVHYYYSLGMQDKEGKRTTVYGRCTDILVSDGSNWKFIAWNCGQQEDDD